MKRLLAFGLALILLPALLWFLYNRIDEAPSAAARELSARLEPPAPLAVNDNAWLHLLGLGAAEAADSLQYATARVAAELARSRLSEKERATAVSALEPLAHVGPDPAAKDAPLPCPVREVDCIEKLTSARSLIESLRASNRVRLDRFERALALREWQILFPPTLEAPNASSRTEKFYLDALTSDLAQALKSNDQSRSLQALQGFADWVEFWRAAQTAAPDLVTIMVAAVHIESAQRIAGDLLDHLKVGQLAALDSPLDRVLAAPLKPQNWQQAMAREHRGFGLMMADVSLGATVKGCLTGSLANDCWRRLYASVAYAPQATLNRHAELTVAMGDWLASDPRKLATANERYAQVMEAAMPPFGDAAKLPGFFAHNPAGKILAVIAIPASPWGMRLQDQEAVRRMIVLKREAMRARIQVTRMPDFLAQQPAALRNPITGAAFDFNPNTHELEYAPADETYWKQKQLSIGYLRKKDIQLAKPQEVTVR